MDSCTVTVGEIIPFRLVRNFSSLGLVAYDSCTNSSHVGVALDFDSDVDKIRLL